MMFIKEDGLLTVHVDNPRSRIPTVCELHQLGRVESPIVELILQALKKKLINSPYYSKRSSINQILRPLGIFLSVRRAKMEADITPCNFSDWQSLVCDYSIWWLTRADSVAKLGTRCTVWEKMVRPFFEYLQEEGIMPLGLVVPTLKLPKEQISYNPRKPKLLGESPAVAVPDNHKAEKAPIDRTIAGPIFWRSDAAYLDEIETIMRSRDAILGAALDDYWLKLVQDYRTGRQLTSQISESEWLKRIRSNDWIYGYQRKTGISFVSGSPILPLCSPVNPDGHLYLLRLMQHMLKEAQSQSDFSYSKIRMHPAANVSCLKITAQTPIAPLHKLTTLTDDQIGQLTLGAFVMRFAGILSSLDMAVAMAILIREHPNLSPDAIAGAMLLNARGKSYLLMTDNYNAAAIFSVNKRRAGCRKYLVLTKRSARIIRHILRTTAPIRALLKRTGHSQWRYLFLGIMVHQGVGHPKEIAAEMLWSNDRKIKIGFACFYPCLAEAGLGEGTLDFSKIRATQGVLAWFDKGSVLAVHRRLGNSYRISIQHYIPEALLSAWNERIIRRFQNTILVLAAAKEEYLLFVVDMPNMSELHRFLAQLIYDVRPGHSPIDDHIQAEFSERFRIEGPVQREFSNLKTLKNESLHIRLNPSSLALLLAYRQWANAQLSPESKRQQDIQTGLTPQHFIDLAVMLQAAAYSENIGPNLSRSLDLRSLKRQFLQAEPKVRDYVKQLRSKSLVFSGVGHE